MNKKQTVLYLLSILLSFASYAQSNLNKGDENSGLSDIIALQFGIGQVLANGFNIEGNALYRRFAFEYSHGMSINTANTALEDGADKDQNIALHIPYTTGFGIGYRFNDWLNLRAESKWHKFELYYDGVDQTLDNLIKDYTTYSIGLGLYANFRPFKKKFNILKGLMISPSFRWWPKLSSSLDNDKVTYFNEVTQTNETHEAREIGVNNTPFFGNISIGYSIEF